MNIKLEIKGPHLVISLTEKAPTLGPDGERGPMVEREVCSASLSLETIRQAMNENARSRYKSEPMK